MKSIKLKNSCLLSGRFIVCPGVPKYIVASLSDPLEVAVAAVLPSETNHGEVEESAYGVCGRKEENSKGIGVIKKGFKARKKERATRGPGRGGGPIKYGDNSGVWRLRMRSVALDWGDSSRRQNGIAARRNRPASRGIEEYPAYVCVVRALFEDNLSVSLEKLSLDVCSSLDRTKRFLF